MFRKVICKLLLLLTLGASVATNVAAATIYDVPSNNDFKTFMDFSTISSKSSNQFFLQQFALTTDEGLRTLNGRYCIALGNGFNVNVGDYVDVELNDRIIKCVVGDIKKNIHTNADNKQVGHNGNVVEFIVETSKLDRQVVKSGNISNVEGFDGSINSITVYDNAQSVSYPNNTIINKYSIELQDKTEYIIEYVYNNILRTAVVDYDFYESVELFNTLYE